MIIEPVIHGLSIFLLAGAGALLRWYLSQKLNSDFPYGTLIVNVVGSFGIGLLLTQNHWPLSNMAKMTIAVGFLGALTTYSSFSYEVLQYIEKGRWTLVAGYVGSTQILAVLGCFLGVRLARALSL